MERSGFYDETWTEEVDLVTELGSHFKHTFVSTGFVEERVYERNKQFKGLNVGMSVGNINSMETWKQ